MASLAYLNDNALNIASPRGGNDWEDWERALSKTPHKVLRTKVEKGEVVVCDSDQAQESPKPAPTIRTATASSQLRKKKPR